MKKFFAIFGVILILSMLGCGSNISEIKVEKAVPKTKNYQAGFNKVWSALIAALSEKESIKVSEKDAGIIVTEFRTVEGKELSLISTSFLGSTYKYSYTINLKKLSKGSSSVAVNVKLSREQIFVMKREESNEAVESYLRQELYKRIQSHL